MGATFLFPSDEPKQQIRFRRYLMAAGTSVMFVVLLALCVVDGVLKPPQFLIAASAVLLFIVGFYAAFRFGLNLRARDPSLTVPMMLSAIAVITYTLYYVDHARGVFLLMYPVVLFFGVFRSTIRTLLKVTAVALTGYALVILLLLQSVQGLAHAYIEILQWVVLAAVLTWFSFMGGHVLNLRARLRETEHDVLTSVYTRRRLLEILRNEKNRCDRGGGPLSVCMMDLDLFKHVNDNLGHYAGDAVLRQFARIAEAELRTIDAMGRFGGEEFLLVLPGTDLRGAQECAERVRTQTEQATVADLDWRVRVTVSIGVAQYKAGERLEDLLRRADAALYRAKDAGRNQVRTEDTSGTGSMLMTH
jgi:diguanylate cyclase (GGDEF)-like protein